MVCFAFFALVCLLLNESLFYRCLVSIFGGNYLNSLYCWQRLIRLSWLLYLLWQFLWKECRWQPRWWLGLHNVDLKVNLRRYLLYLNWRRGLSCRYCNLLLMANSVLKNWPLMFLILLVHTLLGGCFVVNDGIYGFDNRLRVSLNLNLVDLL